MNSAKIAPKIVYTPAIRVIIENNSVYNNSTLKTPIIIINIIAPIQKEEAM